MHMADALLSPAVGLTMDAVSAGALAWTVANVKKDGLADKKIPLMGIGGALVFAAQMINFTIPGVGASGHITGGILLAGLLGGMPAFLSISAVLIIQCLFFADGGLLALGCNIFNMGVIPCLIIYPLLFKPLLKKRLNYRRLSLAAFASAVIGLEAGALCVIWQTLISGVTVLPYGTFMALMLPIHLAIGIVEGLVTAAILCYIYKTRPDILINAHIAEEAGNGVINNVLAALAALTIVAACGLSLFASAYPDGLAWALGKAAGAAELPAPGGIYAGAAAIQQSLAFLPDYGLSTAGAEAAPLARSVSGLLGAGIICALAAAAAFSVSMIKRAKKRSLAAGK